MSVSEVPCTECSKSSARSHGWSQGGPFGEPQWDLANRCRAPKHSVTSIWRLGLSALVLVAGDEDVLVDRLPTGCFQLFRVVPVGYEEGRFLAWSASSQKLSLPRPSGGARSVPARRVLNRKNGQARSRLSASWPRKYLLPPASATRRTLPKSCSPKLTPAGSSSVAVAGRSNALNPDWPEQLLSSKPGMSAAVMKEYIRKLMAPPPQEWILLRWGAQPPEEDGAIRCSWAAGGGGRAHRPRLVRWVAALL